MAESTHKVEVVPVFMEPHPNAEKLSVVRVWGYTAIVNTEDWRGVTLGAYVPPDSLVPIDRPEFAFLKDSSKDGKTARVRAKKLRGLWSQGLLVPAPEGSKLGDDVALQLGVAHYEPPLRGPSSPKGVFIGGEVGPSPAGIPRPKYDVESWRRYGSEIFTPGETVYVTEKIHGTNARYTCVEGQIFCGSRTEWKKEYPSYEYLTLERLAPQLNGNAVRAQEIIDRVRSKPPQQNLWWRALRAYPEVEAWLRAHEGYTLYGEVYGQVQDLTYGTQGNEVRLAFFDVLDPQGVWADADRLFDGFWEIPFPRVPLILRMPYHPGDVEALAEGNSLIPSASGQMREGIVVRPSKERWHPKYGRALLKIVSNQYLERAN